MAADKKGITVKVDADLHAEIRAYLDAHQMTMAEFISLAVEDELHPKYQEKEENTMEKMRTLAFQVPEDLFQRIKDYLHRNNMTQKEFVIGLIENEIDRDLTGRETEAQAEENEEQEDEELYEDEFEEDEEEIEEETFENDTDELTDGEPVESDDTDLTDDKTPEKPAITGTSYYGIHKGQAINTRFKYIKFLTNSKTVGSYYYDNVLITTYRAE